MIFTDFEEEDMFLTASATDCTGLIPAAPADEDELESYEQIQHFLPNYCPKKENK